MKKLTLLLGRICISLIFVTSSITKMFTWDETVHSMTTSLSNWIAATPLPDFMLQGVEVVTSHAVLLFIIATIFEGIGGLFVLLGFKIRLGATLLLLFLIPATVIMHPFWITVGADRAHQTIMFMKNLAIVGGLFILSAQGEE